jgi:LPS-assembly protein
MRLRNFVFITMLAVCHLLIQAQTLTNGAPAAIPDDPAQEILPVAQPEAAPATGVPVEWEAGSQSRAGDTWTLTGGVVVHYRDYTLRADKVLYHQSTTDLEAEGNLQVSGGPNDVQIYATHGDMRLNMHTARYFGVHGSQGVRALGRTTVYSTTNPFYFSARVLLETGEGRYQLVDGTMTNCRLPRPDWELISRAIKVEDGEASAANLRFKLFGLPIFYIPYLRHPVDETGRESGFLIPVFSTGSSIRGYTLGEQIYWVINRSMDMIVGSEYYSKRGWAPNGDFRYKGPGLDHLTARWNAVLDRGVEETVAAAGNQPATTQLVNQGGLEINALGRKDLSLETRIAGNVDYLSSYVYRLTFDDIYSQAVSSEVQSNISITHAHNGLVPSFSLDRFQSFASSTKGDEARILHLPTLRFDVVDQPVANSPVYFGLGSSFGYLSRSEPGFRARNAGRVDFYPHLFLPLARDGWSLSAEAALRETAYSASQTPNLNPADNGTPAFNSNSLNRSDVEAAVDLRLPAVERDFSAGFWGRELRHVIEPQLTYRYVNGIGDKARNVLLTDTSDIATDTNEVGFSLMQRFYLRPTGQQPCVPDAGAAGGLCAPQPREWASWQIAQKLFIDRNFGGALIPDRRNVFATTLDLSAVAFLTSSRSISPVTSRLRFEAIDNLRIEWDMDYDPKAGKMGSDNIYAGYSFGRTTVGIGHALLNAVDENGNAASTIQSQIVTPYLAIGKAGGGGFNMAANGGYDFALGQLQYAGAEASYNWNCCGLTFGYRRFEFGSVRDETQYLYGFTIANFGSVPGISRSKSVFRDPSLPPAY